MDQWVVRNAFRFVQDCRRTGNTSLKTIDINLSAAGILQHNFSDWLVDMARFYQVDPACVVLEITETAATIAHDLLAERMGRLLAHGFRFALDDFGAGYANLAQIMRLPFCIVKLDRSLLVSASGTESAGIVFEDTIRMFHRMQKLTVVEGVETREELARVQALDADHIQGFIYARPMPQCECTGFFAGENRVRVCRVL
ncbi:Oxygen sensor protein DosP [bioreactor metagenome]|uniref:Oxygen sensor protein DosP n=1 Tax=bioreactor metagenome TaxID=1076179 RepID=A0A645BDZ7_9ZZZZ